MTSYRNFKSQLLNTTPLATGELNMWNDVSETLSDFLNETPGDKKIGPFHEHHIRHFILVTVIIFFTVELVGFFFHPIAEFMDHQASVAIVTFGVHTAHSWLELIGVYREKHHHTGPAHLGAQFKRVFNYRTHKLEAEQATQQDDNE